MDFIILLPTLKGFWTSLFETLIRVTAGIPVPDLSTKVETYLLNLFLLPLLLFLSSSSLSSSSTPLEENILHCTQQLQRWEAAAFCVPSIAFNPTSSAGVFPAGTHTQSTYVHHTGIHPATQTPGRQSTQINTNSTNSLRRMEVHSTLQIYNKYILII